MTRTAPRALDRPIPVTRPVVPDARRLADLLAPTLASHLLSNSGPRHEQLQAELAALLGAPGLLLTSSGTAALTLACRSLGIAGEVVTTPLTFAATANAIVRSGGRPVFADVDPVTGNLDPQHAEAAITPQTTAIVAVHLFGVPCDVQGLAEVASRHGLQLIYDAAHAFGGTAQGLPITSFGDATALSFHATKLFNTAEGGALVCRSPQARDLAATLRNHGVQGDTDVIAVGENAKMSELNAAFGLAVLEVLGAERAARIRLAATYAEHLADLPGLAMPAWDQPGVEPHYFPVRIGPESRRSRDEVWAALRELGINTRRYFPLLCDTTAYRCAAGAVRSHCGAACADCCAATGAATGAAGVPIARNAAAQILCLPFFGGLGANEAEWICEAVTWALAG